MNLLLAGFGTALPPHRASQAQALALAHELSPYTEDQRRVLAALYRRSGVKGRHTSLRLPDGAPLRAASPGGAEPPGTAERVAAWLPAATRLACEAGRAALLDAQVEPDAITHVVTVSCTGAAAPGIDAGLMRGLELPPGTERTHVGFMGCHGALNGLRVARGLAAADRGATVLLCAVELCSLHFHYGFDPEKVVANALFADGAAAVVGVGAERGAGRAASAGGAGGAGGAVGSRGAPPGRWSLAATGSCLIPDSGDAMTWTIGDRGFVMTLSPGVPALIAEHLRPWLDGWLAGLGLRLRDVGSWAVHPGGPRILGAVEEALALDGRALAVSRDVLAEHGNMSSPTVLFILQRLAAEGAARPCVALGFGPGLVVEAALLR